MKHTAETSNALRSAERHAREREALQCIETLLEELSTYSAAIPAQRIVEGQEVLLDVSLNGLRCVVLRSAADALRVKLSPREQEIARMVAKGYPNKTIAAVLEISTWTVNTHLRRMFAKLGVHSRAALIAKWLGGKAAAGSTRILEAKRDVVVGEKSGHQLLESPPTAPEIETQRADERPRRERPSLE